jgi:hypothetical protein
VAAPRQVRIRVAGRTRTLGEALRIGAEVEALYTNGPSGGGGAQASARELIAVASTFIARDAITTRIVFEES